MYSPLNIKSDHTEGQNKKKHPIIYVVVMYGKIKIILKSPWEIVNRI